MERGSWGREVGDGCQWQQEERKEKNINCTARQTPKKLLTNERIRGWGVGGEVAKQSKEKEQSGWDGRAIVSWKR